MPLLAVLYLHFMFLLIRSFVCNIVSKHILTANIAYNLVMSFLFCFFLLSFYCYVYFFFFHFGPDFYSFNSFYSFSLPIFLTLTFLFALVWCRIQQNIISSRTASITTIVFLFIYHILFFLTLLILTISLPFSSFVLPVLNWYSFTLTFCV